MTVLRLPLAILFPFVQAPLWELLILAVAAASDGIDGWLARKMGEADGVGALLDPICDKAFVLSLALSYFYSSQLSLTALLILLLRDIWMLLLSLALLPGRRWRDLEVKARLPGKFLTVAQLVFFAICALRWPTDALLPGLLLLSLLACADYTWTLIRQVRSKVERT